MDDYLEWMTLPSVVTMMGCPALSLPVAFTAGGLPVGLQLIGPPRSDRQLLAIAQGIEQLTGVADALPPCGTIGA
jgi:amidase